MLRVQINANHPPEAIDGFLNAIADVWRDSRLPRRRGVAVGS
jgi:hypothetical protein